MVDVSILQRCDHEITPEDILRRAHIAFSKCCTIWNSILNVSDDEVGFETVLKPLNDLDCICYNEFFDLGFIQCVSFDKEQREASTDSSYMLNVFVSVKNMAPDVFKKIKILHERRVNLTAEYKYYLEKLLESGRRFRFDLSADDQEKIKILRRKMNEKCNQFMENLMVNISYLYYYDERLVGVPVDFVRSLPKRVDIGKRIITMLHHQYLPIMKNCWDPKIRKKVKKKYDLHVRQNVAVLEELVNFRHEVAVLLGHPNHASLVASETLAKSQVNVEKFLDKLHKKFEPAWVAEKKKLLDLKKQECEKFNIPYDGVLNKWDLDYYCEKIKEKTCEMNANELREYFPLETVTKGMITIYQKLLGLVINEIENPKKWQPEVRLFSVKNASDGELLGYFFLDLFTRMGTYEHCTIDIIQNGWMKDDGTRQIPVAVTLASFPLPSYKPTLLYHSGYEASVVNYFNLFGRMMHIVCAKNELARFTPYYMPSECLEIPSKMLENWCWERQTLKLMSGHYDTGKPLPPKVLTGLIKSRTANAAGCYWKHILTSRFDQEIHTKCRIENEAVLDYLLQEMLGTLPPERASFDTMFSPLCDYGATYFHCLWNEIIGFDMFHSVFKGHDLTDPALGMRFRKIVLEPGGTKDISDILREFLGRDPTEDTFLRAMRLKP